MDQVKFVKDFKKFEGKVKFPLKACVRYFLPNFYFSPNDWPRKTMKKVFYFI